MILYHFSTSPFARRVRLVLAHKGLDAELRDARAEPAHMVEVKRLNPFGMVPVLVDGDRVVCDSAAISTYLDQKQPHPPIFVTGPSAVKAGEMVAALDRIITMLVDLALRYAPLTDHPSFEAVRTEHVVEKMQGGLDAIAATVAKQSAGRPAGAPLFDDRWSYADIAAYTTVAWMEGLPARAETFPPAKKMLALGWTLPESLRAWAAPHRARPDVAAL